MIFSRPRPGTVASPRSGHSAAGEDMRARVLLLLPVLCAGHASAQTRIQNWKQCVDANPDRSIAGCAAVIAAGQETQADMAVALNNRGNAYRFKGQFDRAIADFDQSIKLSPEYAIAFSNRGLVYWDKGDFDRAIKDYDDAIKLKPDLALAYYNRGLAYGSKGQLDRAMA